MHNQIIIETFLKIYKNHSSTIKGLKLDHTKPTKPLYLNNLLYIPTSQTARCRFFGCKIKQIEKRWIAVDVCGSGMGTQQRRGLPRGPPPPPVARTMKYIPSAHSGCETGQQFIGSGTLAGNQGNRAAVSPTEFHRQTIFELSFS